MFSCMTIGAFRWGLQRHYRWIYTTSIESNNLWKLSWKTGTTATIPWYYHQNSRSFNVSYHTFTFYKKDTLNTSISTVFPELQTKLRCVYPPHTVSSALTHWIILYRNITNEAINTCWKEHLSWCLFRRAMERAKNSVKTASSLYFTASQWSTISLHSSWPVCTRFRPPLKLDTAQPALTFPLHCNNKTNKLKIVLWASAHLLEYKTNQAQKVLKSGASNWFNIDLEY